MGFWDSVSDFIGTGGMLTDPLAGYDFTSNLDPNYLDNFYNLGG